MDERNVTVWYFGLLGCGMLCFIMGSMVSGRRINAGMDSYMNPAFLGGFLFMVCVIGALVVLAISTGPTETDDG